MERLKIIINKDKSTAKEARKLFKELEYYASTSLHDNKYGWVIDQISGDYTNEINWFDNCHAKLVTIPQLKDMVVLNRNSVDDKNVDDGTLYDLFQDSEGTVYFYDHSKAKWKKSAINGSDAYMSELKPIEKEMKTKEYLDKDYVLRSVEQTACDNRVPDGWIEVPDGADIAIHYSKKDKIFFWKDDGLTNWHDKRLNSGKYEWLGCKANQLLTSSEFLKEWDECSKVVWQRSEMENTKQPTGIEATLAERQATYGCFEDVARTTEQIMDALAKPRVNGLNELPYPHRMALYMIASKMARIVNGDFNHKDSWHDIGGYAKLVEDLL